MTDKPNVEVITTVRVGAETKTFAATAATTGDAGRAARQLTRAVADDVADWTHEIERNFR